MANTTASLTNVNLLSKAQYDAISNPASDELWAVDVESDTELKSTIASWGMPSDTYVDLPLGASGSEHTAQANGYVLFERGSTSGNKYISLYNNNSQLGVNGTTISGVANARIFLPVKKGDVFKVSYNANSSNPIFRFIYAEGEI